MTIDSPCQTYFKLPNGRNLSFLTKEHEGQVVFLHELDALGVALESEVEAPEPVSGEGVCAALQHHGRGLVALHDLGHDGHEDVVVAVVVDPVPEGEVDGVVLALAGADVLK